MEKRKRTGMLETAAALKNKAAQGSVGESSARPTDYMVNGINLPRADWKLLRRVAEARGERHGGRRSVSRVIQSLIAEKRQVLETESAEV